MADLVQAAGTKMYVSPIPHAKPKAYTGATVPAEPEDNTYYQSSTASTSTTILDPATGVALTGTKAANDIFYYDSSKWWFICKGSASGADTEKIIDPDKWTSSDVQTLVKKTSGTGFQPRWNEVKELQEVGEYGREYSIVTYSSLAGRGSLKFKGTYDDGTFTTPMGRRDKDKGQKVLQFLNDNDTLALIRLDFVDGSKDYLMGVVTSFRGQGGGFEATLFRNLSVALTRSPYTVTS